MSFFNTNNGQQNVHSGLPPSYHWQPSRDQSVGSGGGLPLEWLGAMVHLQCFLRWRHENQDVLDVAAGVGGVSQRFSVILHHETLGIHDPKLTGGIFFQNGGWWSQPPT